jgi:serine/threonine protein kinase/HJR/Mrr/RecB family endonuclease
MKTHVGHYEIIAELGRGGMGVVYKGYEPSLGRNVAIKELSAALAHDPLVVERFLREARSMAMLNDPHIIQIYSIGQENDQPFFVMEFVDGVSVAALINRDGKLSPGDALKILHQTAQGLGVAHDRGVIHRDVKPANLMISQRGQVKIVDFGIALANQEVDAKLTSQGELVGTPGYLSPEILLGKSVDERSDVYALGIVLFELLIGRTPFSDVSVYKLIQAVVESDVPDVRELNPTIDAELAALVAKMLSKDPDQRYQNMHELIVDLGKHPLLVRGGPIEVSIPAARAVSTTMIGVPMMTPGGGSRLTPGGSPRASTPPPDMSRRTPPPAKTTPAPAADTQLRAKPMFAESAATPTPEKKSWWPMLVMAVLMFLAGATLALHGQIFGSAATETPTSASAASSADTVAAQEKKDTVAAYYEAAIVAVFGLAMTGYWFGIYSRRKRESEVGVHSLANMKWRECIGLVLEAMRRDGYEEAPSSKQPGDGGTDFLLMHDNEPVLLGYKHGTAYRIGDANVREFAHALQMQGAASGILVTLGLAESAARDLAKRYNVQIIDAGALWPKVRPFVSPNTLDHVRLQSSAQAWKGIWIGAACSLAFGAATFLAADLMSPEEKADMIAKVTAATPQATTPVSSSASSDQALKQINDTAQAMAAVAKLTDAQLAQRRADAAKQVSSIVQIGSAGWSSESTLLMTLKQSDGADKALIDEVCRILTQYEELRYTRLQLQPPVNSNAPVRWRQCQ